MRTDPSPGRARRVVGRFSAWLSVCLALSAQASAATYSVPGFSDTAVVTGLTLPTDFAFTPDGRMLVLEKAGRVRIAIDGVLQTPAALDITASVDDTGERGLLGIALHPSFTTTGYLYLYYTTNVPRNRISRVTLSGNTISPASEVVILDNIATAGATNHNGGTIAIGPDGKLYAAPGDAANGANAQNLSTGNFNGKVLRMELDGSPAAGNPSLGAGTEPRIWAWGFRNPFRFSFRPSNGSLYLGDVGSFGTQDREELNVVVAGGDYGWPDAEGTTIYNLPCTGCRPPVFEYTRDIGTTIIGGVFITGNAYPASLRGKYVFGDNGASWIRFLELDANDNLVGGLQNLATGAEGPVAFHQGPDGYLYYAAIHTGRIFRIEYGKNFHTVPPCRVVDTRNAAGPRGGPRLAAGADRPFPIGGHCGVPATARAVAVNVTVTDPTTFGFLVLFPAGGAPPLSSTINFRPGQTRANNAVVTLGATGEIVVRAGMISGGTHVVLDVSGYFD